MKKRLFRYLTLISLFIGIFIVYSTASKNIEPINTDIKEIKVITDDDYAPYSFRDDNGFLKGLIIDEWNLWSIKTGVKVTLEGSNWEDAVNRMENDEYDVIETFYKTKERINTYNFSEPYAKSEIQIFFQKDLLGVTDIESLKGFKIGVKKGDAYISLLEEHGIMDYIEFDKYEPIITSFKYKTIDIFLMGKPPALYYLYKHDVKDDFKFTESDYKNNLHRGIKKKNSEILNLVNKGFSRISDAENKQLQDKWFGNIYGDSKLSSYIKILLIAIISLLAVLFISNLMLKRIIKQKTIEIQKNEDKINAMVKSIPDLFFIIDKTGNFIDYHTNDTNNFFLEPDHFLNKSVYDLFGFIKGLKNAIEQTLVTGEIVVLEYSIPDLKYLNFYESRLIRYDVDHILAVVRDITNSKLTAMKIYDMSIKDEFTGLYNRNFFEKELDKIDSNNLLNYSLIACDLDGLKLVNDTLGHHAGDQYLAMTSEIITKAFGGDNAIISRTGGDEFVVLLKNTSETEILEMLNESNNLMQGFTKEKDLIIPLSISMGHAIADKNSSSIREVLKQADDLMYRNKIHNKQSSRGNFIANLKNILEARNYDTDDHCKRIETLSIKLAQSIGFNDDQLKEIILLAKFHDFGKVGISEDILLKTSKLTDDEFKEMKRHSEIGYRIAKSSPEISHIADFILHHHEWWNGDGYPLGLAGDKIPMPCRILSIADAYDAMTNDRPYRKALSKEEAIAELKKFSGIQFDPNLVPKFIKIVSNI